jgi:hypothetical protein
VRLSEQGRQQLLGELLDLQSGGELRGWDEAFIDDMVMRLAAARDGATLSEKQYEQISRILDVKGREPSGPPSRPNSFPYRDQGGVSYFQRRGWAVNKRKRK